MNKYFIFILLSFILSACNVLAPEPTATITLTHSPTSTPTPSQTPTPTPNPYLVGRDSEGNIVVNHLYLSNVIRTGDVPEDQFAIEQAYLEAHPEIIGAENSVADEVLCSERLPYCTLHTIVQRDNVLCINLNDVTGNMEIVYLQEDPTNHVIVSVHVIISVEAQAAWLASASDVGRNATEPYLLSYGDNLQRFISGDVQALDLYIFMNSQANPDLISDPAFADIRILRDFGGRQWILFSNLVAGILTPENIQASASTISRTVFASCNVQLH